MSYYNRECARSAVLSGSFLPFCALSGLSPEKPLNDFYDIVTDGFNVLGVGTELDELKGFHNITEEKATEIMMNMRIRVISAIERSYGSVVSGWFYLGFSLSLIAALTKTASDRINVISTNEEILKKIAMQAGYAKSKLDNILHRLQSAVSMEDLLAIIQDFLREAFKIIETPRLFISYGSRDYKLAEEFANLCKRANIDTFVANIDISPGTDWYSRLGDEIRQSDEILLIISPESIHSHWVMIEVGAAWALGKQIIPAVLYEDINALPEPIKRFQAQKIISTTERRNLVKKIAERMHNRS